MSDAGSAGAMPTILHLGVGSFHRAHQAVYLQWLNDALPAQDERWSIVGANLRADMVDVIAALAAQKCVYTVETISPAGEHAYEAIHSIRDVIAWEPGIAPVIACGAAAQTRIISFTVTESGYYLGKDAGSSDALDWTSYELQADLERARAGQAGSTIYGGLFAILLARMQAGVGPVTLLSCDNLRHNGARVRAGLFEFATRATADRGDADAGFCKWLQANTSCPGTMVDRITPRPPPELRARVLAATGVDDAAAITAESFIQWVIEADFIAGRPAWEKAGVEVVASVAPYEEAKVRILNASHSCIAWAGTLAGKRFIHEGMQDATIRQMAFDYVTDDVIPCLTAGSGAGSIDLAKYRDVVLERFGNPLIRDTNLRVAMDGFSKLNGFVAPTLRECLASGRSCDSVALLPALFLAYLQVWHGNGLDGDYVDHAMDPAVGHAICAAPDPVAALCAVEDLWGDIAGDARLVTAVRGASARVDAWRAAQNPSDNNAVKAINPSQQAGRKG